MLMADDDGVTPSTVDAAAAGGDGTASVDASDDAGDDSAASAGESRFDSPLSSTSSRRIDGEDDRVDDCLSVSSVKGLPRWT